jgi:hypothetical protein
MKFPWKRTKASLVMLMSVSTTCRQEFDEGQKTQQFFCCVKWMSSEMGSCKFLWGLGCGSEVLVSILIELQTNQYHSFSGTRRRKINMFTYFLAAHLHIPL